MAGVNSSAIQQYRQIPFHRFQPGEPQAQLPKGAFVGQFIEFNTPDRSAYFVCKNGPTPLSTPFDSADNEYGVYTGSQPLNKSFVVVSDTNIGYAVKRGKSSLTLNLSAAVSENRLSGGKLVVTTTAQNREYYYIQRNAASTGTDNTTKIYLLEDLRKDLTAATDISVISNPLNGVEIGDSNNDWQGCAGFTVTDVPANYYFLSLVRGIIRVQMNGAVDAGDPLMVSTTEGRVIPAISGEQVVAHALSSSTSDGSYIWVEADLI